MVIRKANYEETQKILAYSLDVLKESTSGLIEPSWEKALQLVTPLLENNGYYLIYTEGSTILGWVGVGSSYDIYSNQAVGFLTELYVLPPYRNQGIAKMLCVEACEQLKNRGYNKIQLNVFAGNKANQLYRKLGFHEVSTLMEWNVK